MYKKKRVPIYIFIIYYLIRVYILIIVQECIFKKNECLRKYVPGMRTRSFPCTPSDSASANEFPDYT